MAGNSFRQFSFKTSHSLVFSPWRSLPVAAFSLLPASLTIGFVARHAVGTILKTMSGKSCNSEHWFSIARSIVSRPLLCKINDLHDSVTIAHARDQLSADICRDLHTTLNKNCAAPYKADDSIIQQDH